MRNKKERRGYDGGPALFIRLVSDVTGHCSTTVSVRLSLPASCLWCDAILPTCQDDIIKQDCGRQTSPPFQMHLGQASRF